MGTILEGFMLSLYKQTSRLVWIVGTYITFYFGWLAMLNWTPFGKKLRKKNEGSQNMDKHGNA